jgi:hypothetical protein
MCFLVQITARAQAHAEAEREKLVLARKLEAMQEKLLIGVKVLDKAARQEEELRRAQVCELTLPISQLSGLHVSSRTKSAVDSNPT